jgi:hypothetical protein
VLGSSQVIHQGHAGHGVDRAERGSLGGIGLRHPGDGFGHVGVFER